ncbi:MAG: transcriptional regulator NrdR [bacterium]|jgi:transcriptional repressor NrdR
MRCPRCGHSEDKVIDSRASRNGDVIRRRRVCVSCAHRFTTREEVVKVALHIIKRDGRHEELSREKLINGIARACEKRPVSMADIETIVDNIITELGNDFEREVTSDIIGEKVMERLEKIDEVAYVRFASVYRRFKDVNQFINAIQGMVTR